MSCPIITDLANSEAKAEIQSHNTRSSALPTRCRGLPLRKMSGHYESYLLLKLLHQEQGLSLPS